MDALVILIPLMPLLATLLIGVGHFSGLIEGERGESATGIIAVWSISMSVLLSLVLLGADLGGNNVGSFSGGYWLKSDNAAISFDFVTHGFNVQLVSLFALMLMLVMKFSINYLHREAGFHRFFCFLSLFSGAIFLIVVSDNAVMTFFGWEIAGLCSYLLIAYRYERSVAAENATQVFCINRIGDAAFLLGIGMSYVWLESMTWSGLNAAVPDLTKGQAATLAACFVIAALAKSAQLPFSPWLNKAMEGPTPSSAIFYGAVMIHAGVFLVIQIQPLVDHSPLAKVLLVGLGGATFLYSYLTVKTQTDVKSSQVFAVLGQLSLMFIECGFGFWLLAQWHLCAHAIVRCYSVLTAPSLIFNVKENPVRPVPIKLAAKRRLFLASLQRFWLEQINDWAWARPLRRLARDLSYFDDNFVDQVMGVPVPAMYSDVGVAIPEASALPQNDAHNRMVAGTGLVGKVMSWLAVAVHWFEERLVLQGVARDSLLAGRALGYFANKFETKILRPRYLVLFVFITFLVAF